jgi:hypothetical protein
LCFLRCPSQREAYVVTVMHRIAKANIDRFNLLLEAETDPIKRAMMIRLLAEEKHKLKAILSGAKEAKEA